MYLENKLCKVDIKIDKNYSIKTVNDIKCDIVHNFKKYHNYDICAIYLINIESNKFSKKIAVIGDLCSGGTNYAILEEEILTIMQDTFICQIRVTDGELVGYLEFEFADRKFGIYKIKNSYLIHGEIKIVMLDSKLHTKFGVLWKDNFVSSTDKKPFEICEDSIKIYDWKNNSYEIDFNGYFIGSNHVKNEIFLGKPNNGWIEIKIGDFKCEASDWTDIPFDIVNSAIFSLEKNIPFVLELELEKYGNAYIFSSFKYTYIIHDFYGDINEHKSYCYDINHKEVIHTLVSELKKEANEWCVWYGWKDWNNKKEIKKSKKELLEKINKVEELLKK